MDSNELTASVEADWIMSELKKEWQTLLKNEYFTALGKSKVLQWYQQELSKLKDAVVMMNNGWHQRIREKYQKDIESKMKDMVELSPIMEKGRNEGEFLIDIEARTRKIKLLSDCLLAQYGILVAFKGMEIDFLKKPVIS